MNRLTLDTAKMDGFFLWVMLHDINDREPIRSNDSAAASCISCVRRKVRFSLK